MSFSYLDEATLQSLKQASTELFTAESDVNAVSAGIYGPYVGRFSGAPLPRLVTMLGDMNRVRNLVNGQIPLVKFLNNAILLSAGQEQENIFRDALQKTSLDQIPNDLVTGDVSQIPRTPESGPEVQIAGDDTLDIGFLFKGAEVSKSVAHLSVHRHINGQPSYRAGDKKDIGLGTGWIIGHGLLITNHHVIAARARSEPSPSNGDFQLQAEATTVKFDYYSEDSEGTLTETASLLASDNALDYAILGLKEDAPERLPLKLRKSDMIKETGTPLKERVNVIQHPNGDPMRLGFRNNYIVSGTSDSLSYLTDTAGGSSGSPVCDDAWYVAALHRGWRSIDGEALEIKGTKVSQQNYGVPLKKILAQLKEKDESLYSQILESQILSRGTVTHF